MSHLEENNDKNASLNRLLNNETRLLELADEMKMMLGRLTVLEEKTGINSEGEQKMKSTVSTTKKDDGKTAERAVDDGTVEESDEKPGPNLKVKDQGNETNEHDEETGIICANEGSRSNAMGNTENPSSESSNIFPADSYSLLAVHGPRKKWGFVLISVMVFIFQVALLVAMMLSIVVPEWRSSEVADGSNPIFPGDVEPIVKVVQVLALLVHVLFPDHGMTELIKVANMWPTFGKIPDIRERQDNVLFYFMLSLILRLVQGILANIATFFLIFTSVTATDVILNFVALGFVSGLDDTAFESMVKGYFGQKIEEETQKVQSTLLPDYVPKTCHIFRTCGVMLFIFLSMTTVGFVAVIGPQINNAFLTESFRVEFGAESGLEQHSGCYDGDGERRFSSRRPIYKMKETENKASTKARFEYCKKERKWYFFEAGDEDLCKATTNDSQFLAYSSKSASFDIEAIFSDPWYSSGGVNLDVEYLTDGVGVKEGCGKRSGDGVCDDELNTPEFKYDGGDCCAATCNHPECGLNDVDTVFQTTLAASGDGYPSCLDPAMVGVIVTLHSVIQTSNSRSSPPLLAVSCGGRNELRVSIEKEMAGKEEVIKVKDGEICRVAMKPGYTVAFSLAHSIALNDETVVKTNKLSGVITTDHDDGNSTEFELIPRCYFQKFSDAKISLDTIYTNKNTPKSKAIHWMVRDTGELSYSDCENPFFLERYALVVAYLSAKYTQTFLHVETDKEINDELIKHRESQCFWPFVSCNGGHVVGIDLQNLSFKGTIATELALLSKLEKLVISTNPLTGSIPSELGLLTNMSSFQLVDNQLTGSVPSELGLLTNIEKFSLSLNPLTGSIPSELGLLTNMSSLELENNTLVGSLPSELTRLTNIQHFNLANNQLTGSIPSELGLLTNMSSLRLDYNQLTGTIPSEVGLLTNMLEIFLEGNNFTGNVSSIFCEPQKSNVIVMSCDKVTCSCCNGCE